MDEWTRICINPWYRAQTCMEIMVYFSSPCIELSVYNGTDANRRGRAASGMRCWMRVKNPLWVHWLLFPHCSCQQMLFPSRIWTVLHFSCRNLARFWRLKPLEGGGGRERGGGRDTISYLLKMLGKKKISWPWLSMNSLFQSFSCYIKGKCLCF